MTTFRSILVSTALAAACLSAAASLSTAAENGGDAPAPATEATELPEGYSCLVCHRKDGDLWSDVTPTVSEEDLAGDVHWQKGIRCHDCHGGNPNIEEYTDHRKDDGFRALRSPADVPKLCGHCHSNIEYMRRYRPSPRTDQEAEYWTSGHGQRLKKAAEDYEKVLKTHAEAVEGQTAAEEEPVFPDPQVATCISCHSEKGKHDILAVTDQKSPVYPARVAETCATCHSDPKVMAGRKYHGRDLGHDQYDLWKASVHGQAMLVKGDLSAPTCNDCHGNHGAVPPEVDSVANACGTCHGKVAKLFSQTRMKHKFEEVGLPGCATCHGNHQTLSPTDEMVGMEGKAVCVDCHKKEGHDEMLAGATIARTMRDGLEQLKREIAEAERKVAEAERLGMEVRGPRFDLRKAQDSLTNARSLIHNFAPGPMEEALAEGLEVTSEVKDRAEAALAEHTYRRVWLAVFLAPILLVVALLLAYIRTLPLPAK